MILGDRSTHKLCRDVKPAKISAGKSTKSFMSKSKRVSWPREAKRPGESSVSLFLARSLKQSLERRFTQQLNTADHRERKKEARKKQDSQDSERRQEIEYTRRKLIQPVVVDISANMVQQQGFSFNQADAFQRISLQKK